jgi:hypothetical protein
MEIEMAYIQDHETDTYWCPMVRAQAGEEPSSNSGGTIVNNQPIQEVPLFARCRGSSCMMWRWFKDYDENKDDDRGFCGLAGAPLKKM